MSWRSGSSLSRSLISAARTPSLRSPPPLHRARPPPIAAPRRPSFASPSRNLGQLGCVQSMLPLNCAVGSTVRLTSHLVVDARAFAELSNGSTFSRTCQDR